MEFWNDIIADKSKDILFELRKNINFVLIGGWAVWLYTQTTKSKDIDIYIDFTDFFKLQNFFISKGIGVGFNSKLNKYEAKIGEVDIDIYTPDHCNLIVNCKDVFRNKLFKRFEGFNIILPEALLLLKLNAEKERSMTIKGFKDRVDILSLIYCVKFNEKLLIKQAKEYNIDLNALRNIIKMCEKEYSYFFDDTKDLCKLKKLKIELLKKIAV